MSRGLKNNNPGNIRLSAVRYKGETASSDTVFKRFENAAWGYRAMFVLMHTYQLKHGLTTLREMIGRYAPPCENDTPRYVNFVANSAGLGADESIDTLSRAQMLPVVCAMSRMENGVEARVEDAEAGWELFVMHKP